MSTRVLAALAIAVLATAAGCSKNKKPTAELASNSSATGTRGKTPVTITGTKNNGDSVSFDPVYFEFDQSEIQGHYRDSLTALAKHMKANPKMLLTVEGHCDESGTVEYNIALGDRRARAIKDYLNSQGVADARVSIISYGEERPAVSGKGEDVMAKNRRGMLVDRSR